MTYVAPTTVVAGQTYSAAAHNVIVNDIVDLNNRYQIVTSSTRPTSPTEGQVIYETDTNNFYIYSGSAWISYAGIRIVTTTQRGDITGVTGLEVYNTTTGAFEAYNGSTCQISRPFAMEGNRANYATNSTITLTSGRFSQAPIVTTGMNSRGSALTYVITGSITTTSFAIEYSSVGTFNLSWVATQMKSGSAGG